VCVCVCVCVCVRVCNLSLKHSKVLNMTFQHIYYKQSIHTPIKY